VFREGQTIVKIWERVLLWFLEQWLQLVQFNNDFSVPVSEVKDPYQLKKIIH